MFARRLIFFRLRAFVAQGVTGAAIERPFEGVLEDPAETGLQAGGFFPPLGLKESFLLYGTPSECI